MKLWPFSRKPKPLTPGPINEDWMPGDLAECIFAGPWMTDPDGINFNGPEKGDTLKVVDVEPARCSFGDGWYLRFNGDPQNWWAAMSFRKVPPLDSKCDTEFAETIREASKRSLRTKAWYDAKEHLGIGSKA
jgi:hypothetical protein